jgi:outer membrane protein
MKYIQLLISVVALVVSLFVGYKFAGYQPQGMFSTRIAIIDSDKVINESLALQNIQQQIKEQNSKLQQEFEKELEKFKPSKEEFDLLSEAAKEEKTEEFNKQAIRARDDYTKKMSSLEESYRDAVDSIFNKIKDIAKKTAEKNNIHLVLFISKKNQVLYSADEVDLSNVVLNNINKEMPEFTLKIEK